MNEFEYCLKHIKIFEAARDVLLKQWMASEDVQKILNSHTITTSFFGKYFGSKVIDYAFGVIQGSDKLGNCPVIGAMLVFFEKKNIPLKDVFMICVNLKNAMIAYALKKGILDDRLLHEICMLVDHNFCGVIEEYLDLHYALTVTHDSCTLDTKQVIHTETVCIVSPTASSTSALQYIQDAYIDYEILEELSEIEKETVASFNFSKTISEEIISDVIELFTKYAKMIDRLVEFRELSYALWILTDLLKNVNMEAIQEELLYMRIYIKAIISDLSTWRVSVFIDQNAEDIHYLDKTLLSSIAQLQIMLSPQEDNNIEDVEFF